MYMGSYIIFKHFDSMTVYRDPAFVIWWNLGLLYSWRLKIVQPLKVFVKEFFKCFSDNLNFILISWWFLYNFNNIKSCIKALSPKTRGSPWRCSIREAVLKNFSILTGKHLIWSFFLKKHLRTAGSGMIAESNDSGKYSLFFLLETIGIKTIAEANSPSYQTFLQK